MSDSKIYEIPSEVEANSHIDATRYKEMYEHSISSPDEFWAEQARSVSALVQEVGFSQ